MWKGTLITHRHQRTSAEQRGVELMFGEISVYILLFDENAEEGWQNKDTPVISLSLGHTPLPLLGIQAGSLESLPKRHQSAKH